MYLEKSYASFHCCLVSQSCPTLWDPMDYRVPGFPVLQYVPKFTETHIHLVDDAIQHLIFCFLFSCLQSFSESGHFLMSQFFRSDGQSIGVSASASVLQMNVRDWFPLGRTGSISLQFKGLSRVFSNTTIQKHQFSFLYSPSSHIHTWLLQKP